MASLNGFGRNFGGIGRALSERNYRIYWYGHLFSSNGVWIYLLSSQWLMFHLIQSPAWLGAVGFAYMSPVLFLGPLAGAISDRYGHRRTGMIALSLGIVTSFMTAIAIVTGILTPVLLIVFTLVQGIFFSFDFPARQALILQLIERKNLSAAIGMNTTTFHTAGFTGPIIGSVILSFGNLTFGEPLGAALSYMTSAMAFCCMVLGVARVQIINPLPVIKSIKPLVPAVLSDLRAGIHYIMECSDLKMIMLLSIFVAFCLRSYQNLMAGFAEQVFQLDEHGLGNLMAASGIGALSAALILAVRGKVEGLTRIFVYGAMLTALALLVFVSNTQIHLALVTMALVGGFIVATSLGGQTLIQNIVEDEFRARVVSVHLAIVVGGSAFGTLGIGLLAEFVGFQTALGVMAVLALIVFTFKGRKLLSRSIDIEAVHPAKKD